MASRYQAGTGNTDVFLSPLHALGMWNPFFTAPLKGNGLPQEGVGAIASEWQGFVGHRLQEDIALMQRLMQSRTPDQVVAAYSEFWQKAAEDYGKEFNTMTKLMTGQA